MPVDLDDCCKDYIGQPITPGDKIVYSAGTASSTRFILARVDEVVFGENSYGGNWKLKIRRIRDGKNVLKPGRSYDDPNRVVTMHFPDRVVVVHPEAE